MKRTLRSRLSEMQRTGEVKTGRQLADSLQANQGTDLFPDLPGEASLGETPFGPCYMREIKYPLGYRHGGMSLAGVLSCREGDLTLCAGDSALRSFDPRQALFLDTETTGLSGGAGTWAFLIGLGWLEGNHFMTRQYFLRRPAEERAILSHFAAMASEFPTLVTFNGKMFDLPLIQTRQTLAGFRQTIPPRHLDLLHCARLLWKNRLASRSLRSLEEALLGLQRSDDIPGAEIPAVYFDFLRRGKTEQLKKVFRHNILDILSMVTLLERVSSLSAGRLVEHPAEALAMGRLCLRSGRTGRGEAYLREAAGCSLAPLAEEAALELALHYKREGKWAEAELIWQNAVKSNPANPAPYIELAKYYEHRLGDYRAAIKLTGQAAALAAGADRGTPPAGELSVPALQHRLNRLRRRLSRQAKLPPE